MKKSQTRRNFLLTVSASAGALAAAACGGGSDNESTSGTSGASGTTAAGTPLERTQAPTGAYTPAAKEQQVWVMEYRQPSFLDPHKSNFAQDIAAERLLSRPLFWVDEKGTPTAAVAAELPTRQNNGVSADGKTMTIKLRDGQKFSDGSPLTAKDFEYSIKRALHPKLASLYASELHNIVGAKEFNTAKTEGDFARLRDAVGVRAVDDKTLEVKLVNPQPTMPSILGMWMAYPVKQSAVEANGAPIENTDWAVDPRRNISNGPFVLKEYKEKDRIVLEANPNYTLEPKPKLQRIEMRIVEDEEVAYQAFQTGELDFSRIPTSKIPLVDQDPNLKKQNVRAQEPTIFWLRMNNATKPFDNVKVRQAFAKAIDRDAFIKVVLGGVGEQAQLFTPLTVPGAQKEDGEALKYDAARAKALLAEAGFPNGQGFPELGYITTQATVSQNAAQFIQRQLRENLGVNIRIDTVDTATSSSRVNNKQYDLSLGGWHEDYHDPENWIPTQFPSDSSNNKYNFSSKRLDDLVNQARFELDETKRIGLYRQMMQVAVEEVPVAPIYQRTNNYLVRSKVRGITVHPLDSMFAGNILIERVEIAKE